MQLSIFVPSLWNLPLGDSRLLFVFLEVRACIYRWSIWGLTVCMKSQQKCLRTQCRVPRCEEKNPQSGYSSGAYLTWLKTPTYSILRAGGSGGVAVHLLVWSM